MKETAGFSVSSYTNAVLAALFQTDQLMRMEQKERTEQQETTEKKPVPEQKGNRKNNSKSLVEAKGQVSVWDLMDD